MKKVIELLRVSTKEQAGEDRNGLPAQRAANRRTCEQHGLQIVETVELIDVSGAAILFESEMQRLLREIVRPDIHGVVTREFSRLMRPNDYSDYKILERFVQTNTLLYLPTGPLNFGDKMGRIIGTVQGLMSGLELEMIKERMMGGKEAMRRKGLWAAGGHCLPYGVTYDRGSNKFAYRPEESAKVAEVFRLFLRGDTNYDRLSCLLGMTRGTAKNILRNPIYSGWLVFDHKRDPSPQGKYGIDADGRPRFSKKTGQLIRDRKRIARSEEDVIRVRVIDEPLVSEVDFARVQSIIARKAQISLRQRRKVGHFTFNGFLWCSKCGARLHTFRNQFDRYYYVCSNKKRKDPATGEKLCPSTGYMNRDRLETLLGTIIANTLRSPEILERIAEEHSKRIEAACGNAERDRAEKLVETLQTRRERTVESYIDGTITKNERDLRLRIVDIDLRAATVKLAQLDPVKTVFDPLRLGAIFEPFAEWEFLSRTERRQMLNAVAPRFEVADYWVRGLALSSAHLPTDININKDSRWRTVRFALRALLCPSLSRRGLCWRAL